MVFLKYLLKQSKRKFVNYSLGVIFIFTIGGIVAINLLPEQILRWAIGAFESDSQHNSTSIVVDWLIHTNFELKTLFIGDAKYTNVGGGYYKGVDIGLYRQIFYGGIIGVSIIAYFHNKILVYVRKLIPKDPYMKCFTLGMFLSYLISLLKGDLSMIDLYMLILVNVSCITSIKTNGKTTSMGSI
jgi:hypothetical protein